MGPLSPLYGWWEIDDYAKKTELVGGVISGFSQEKEIIGDQGDNSTLWKQVHVPVHSADDKSLVIKMTALTCCVTAKMMSFNQSRSLNKKYPKEQ